MMGILEVREVEIWLLDQTSGPLVWWRSAMSRIAMFRAITNGQMGRCHFCEWKASYKGQWRNLSPAVGGRCVPLLLERPHR